MFHNVTLNSKSTGQTVAESLNISAVDADVRILVIGPVVAINMGFECPNDVRNDTRSLRRRHMPNADQFAGEVTNPVFDSAIIALDPPDVGLPPRLVCGSRKRRFDCEETLSGCTEHLHPKSLHLLGELRGTAPQPEAIVGCPFQVIFLLPELV
jgi:hypothetical protein